MFDANVVLNQMGGVNRLAAMCGAKMFTSDNANRRVAFKLPARFARDGINYVRVTLEANDTYTVEFMKIIGVRVTEFAQSTGIYADQLRAVFTQRTGLDVGL